MDSLESKLVKDSWINPNQYIKAKEEQKINRRSLYSILIKLGYLREEDVFSFFSQNTEIPFVNISDYAISEELIKLFSEQLYREYLFLPLCKVKKTLYVAMANPLDTNLDSMLSMHTNFEIYPLFASISSLRKVIDNFFGFEDKYLDLDDLIVPPRQLQEIPFWRESERLSLNLPAELKPDDERITLTCLSYIQATATDISRSGKALGIKVGVFLPAETKILLKFPSKDPFYEIQGEVARCAIAERNHYLLGVRVGEFKKDLLQRLLDEAQAPPTYTT